MTCTTLSAPGIERGTGGQGIQDADLIIDETNVCVSPVLMYLAGDRYSAVDPDSWVRVDPDLAIEIVSPASVDDD